MSASIAYETLKDKQTDGDEHALWTYKWYLHCRFNLLKFDKPMAHYINQDYYSL
jgi:hypothetical protein